MIVNESDAKASSSSGANTQNLSSDAGANTQKLEFTTNSVRNTTLATEDDLHYYEIVTRFWHPKLTKINFLNPDTQVLYTVAEIEKTGQTGGGIPQHRVRFLKEGKEREWEEWMACEEFVKVQNPDKIGGTFVHQGVEYRWKTHNRKLQLVRADDEEKNALVIYHPHHRYFFVFRMTRHAALELKPEVTKLLDRLIASYIIVENRRRAHKLPL
ncbi:hypothetical protein C8J56DRAFT_1005946 [Mycena floridula]|nr:hypothetical protein C8J56DRAFT_244096 [Mycena floridula]KAJ7582096.1 hypothetical protein C8J56DRAFT_1005946 [Mycena floridula]